MTNVISLSVPQRRQPFIQNAKALVSVFADPSQAPLRMFFGSKENAELLTILECTGTPIPEDALATHQSFYQQPPAKMALVILQCFLTGSQMLITPFNSLY